MSVKLLRNQLTPSARKMARGLKQLPIFAFDAFVGFTPFRSGNAINKTKLRGTVIEANYPYAKRLDKGYSKQARRGMTEPTIKEIERNLKSKVIRK